MRKINLVSGAWKYKIGRSGVRFECPNGKTFYVRAHLVKGVDPDTLERGQWKRTSDGMITPSDIRRYIEGLA